MNPTYRLCLSILLVTPLAASHGCSVQVSNTESQPRTQSPLPSSAPALSTRAPVQADDVNEGEDETDEQAWQAISVALEKPGDLRDGVLTFVFPRDDLEVTVQGNETPVGAGIGSDFRFYRCPCGRINVIGQFVVADYEANDVVDALREGQIEIASIGPLLLHERPRLLLIRFQGEHKRGGPLAKTVRAALSWTSKERMPPQKLDH